MNCLYNIVYLLFLLFTIASGQSVSKFTLDLFAAYAGATYHVKDTWNLPPACQRPDMEGTEILYNQESSLGDSFGYIAINPNTKLIIVAFRGCY